MSDDTIQSLNIIEDGDVAAAKPLRENFKYLDDRITAQATSISNKETISNKNTANGYCGLNANGEIPSDVLNKAINSIVGGIYPVGSIYVTTSTSNTCPIASFVQGSTWEKVAAGRVLQGADSNHAAGTTIAAGLPNITGTVDPYTGDSEASIGIRNATGVFYSTSTGNIISRGETNGGRTKGLGFNASRSSSVYGANTTVQPPAYVVNIWRRTA